MKKTACIAMALVILVLACAPITHYPIHLRYTPEEKDPQANAERKKHVVTVITFADNRDVPDREILGQWVDNENKIIPFVSSKGNPATNVSRAFETYLLQKGYTVRAEPKGWDLRSETMRPAWGDWVIGGSIEELSVEARAEGVIIHYDCKLKLKIVVADVKEQKNEYEDTLESSSSYERAMFSPAVAEHTINKMLTKAVERMLDHIEDQ